MVAKKQKGLFVKQPALVKASVPDAAGAEAPKPQGDPGRKDDLGRGDTSVGGAKKLSSSTAPQPASLQSPKQPQPGSSEPPLSRRQQKNEERQAQKRAAREAYEASLPNKGNENKREEANKKKQSDKEGKGGKGLGGKGSVGKGDLGKSKGHDGRGAERGVNASGESAATKMKKRHGRRAKPKLKACQVTDAKCRRQHTMLKRGDNPRGYTKQACCDRCGMDDMPRKCDFFFHCSFCRFDVCPNCILQLRTNQILHAEQQAEAKKAKKKGGPEAEAGVPGKDTSESNDMILPDALQPHYDRVFASGARRDFWIPSEATAINRAPLEVKVVSNWKEGVPL